MGAVAVGGFIGGAGGATVQKNHPTVGIISNGAIVEREIPATIVQDGRISFSLRNPDFTSASRMADAINAAIVVFQGWDFVASCAFEEHRTAIMLGHHLLAFICGYFSLVYEVSAGVGG